MPIDAFNFSLTLVDVPSIFKKSTLGILAVKRQFLDYNHRLTQGEQWRSKRGRHVRGGGILDKLYVIIFLNYFEQPLFGYIACLLIVNYITVLPSAQAQSCGNRPRHLVYALVYSREYKKDLILMCIMSQLRTVFFVFALFESLILSVRMQYRQYYASDMGARRGGHGAMAHLFGSVIRC